MATPTFDLDTDAILRVRPSGLADRYRDVRRNTRALCAPLSPEDCAIQSMTDASPAKWHLAHTTWFFETLVLEAALPGYEHFRPEFRVLFNSYYESIGDKHPRPRRGMLSRPSLDEVLAYRRHVDEHMTRVLDGAEGVDDAFLDVVELGLNHEQQHQELIVTDIKHMLSCNPLHPVYRDAAPVDGPAPRAMRWHRYDAGVVEIGHEGPAFAFDNETPRHQTFLHAFELASRPVTVGEYLAFMADGGYRRPEFWLSDGWATTQVESWCAPYYWHRLDDRWYQFTLGGLREIDEREPVCHVSYYEADAYARWAGARLPSEAEWELAAAERPVEGNLLERGHFHPVPAASPTDDGYDQLFGDVWEWTRSGYEPYPGFVVPSGPLGEYNSKFMCNQMVLRGGSCATPQSHLRVTYRNFFPPGSRWQFAGIRLARDAR